jgi:hypothetical protein
LASMLFTSRCIVEDDEKKVMVYEIKEGRTGICSYKKVAVLGGNVYLSSYHSIAKEFGRREAATRWNHDSGIIICCYRAASDGLAVGNALVHMIMTTVTNNRVIAISSFREDFEHSQTPRFSRYHA